MKHKVKISAALLLAVCFTAFAAEEAKTPPETLPVPDGAPTAKDLGEPQITIRSKGRERLEEYRLNGKLYMIRVTPPKGKPYYLIDQTGRGQFVRHDGPVEPTAVPQWVIHTF